MLIKSGTLKRYALVGESVSFWAEFEVLYAQAMPSVEGSLHLLPEAHDEEHKTPPGPCLRICCCAFCHDVNRHTPWNCKPTPIKCFIYNSKKKNNKIKPQKPTNKKKKTTKKLAFSMFRDVHLSLTFSMREHRLLWKAFSTFNIIIKWVLFYSLFIW